MVKNTRYKIKTPPSGAITCSESYLETDMDNFGYRCLGGGIFVTTKILLAIKNSLQKLMQSTTHIQEVWQRILGKDETVEYEFSLSSKYTTIWMVFWSLLFIMTFIGPFIFYFYFKIYLKKANIYGFTNKRILIHKGWLSSNTISIDYSKITDIRVNQSFLEKTLINSGSLYINTAGSGNTEVVLSAIDNPYEVKKILDDLRETN